MNPILKRIIFVIAFILLTLIAPAVILLLFVDASQSFSVYVIAFGVIIFAILGYIVSCIRDMQKKIDSTMDEIKMQNAAIAYKISNNSEAFSEPAPVAPVETATAAVDTSSIPLNPAEPLDMPSVRKAVKATDDGFDDFK